MAQTKNVIVSISRQSGSAGRKIGKALAEKLGWNLYDKELLNLTAQESGSSPEIVADVEHAHSSMFGMAMERLGANDNGNADFSYNIPLNEQMFTIQSRIIRGIADRENAVIVGRCADAALAEYAPVISVFIQGSEETRIQRVMKREDLSHEDAKKRMKLIDKTRATYHDYYAETKWGQRENYDLVINSDIGIEASADIICAYVKAMLKVMEG